MMPRMGGVEMMIRLKELYAVNKLTPYSQGTKFVLSTALSEQSGGINFGNDFHYLCKHSLITNSYTIVEKPIINDQLVDIIMNL